jgi:ubiquinone/menaquinone biosynthesis C-methylase UbiE
MDKRAVLLPASGHLEGNPMSDDSPAAIYEAQLVQAIFEPLARILIERARPKPGEHVLDAACGTGIVARLVAPIVSPSGRTVGLDYDPTMIEMARSLAPEIEWRQGDLQKLPFPDGVYDLVICQQGLQYLPDPGAGLRQFHRVLRPGGRMVLATWSDPAKSPGHVLLFQALAATIGPDRAQPVGWSLADEARLLELVSEAGFVSVTTTIISLQTRYPSARAFVEIVLKGSSKVTREELAQIPADRRVAFVDEVAMRLRDYETSNALILPMESRVLVANRP